MVLPIPLLVVAVLAFSVEAVTGFGATVVALSLGARFLPMGELLPPWVLCNLGLSLAVTARNAVHVDRSLLLGRILPWMALGFPVGAVGMRVLEGRGAALPALFGAFVVVIALRDLWGPTVGSRQWPPFVFRAAMVVAGIIHGLWGTGGPVVVWSLGRESLDKHRFRATLSALWLCLSVLLLLTFALEGRLNRLAWTRAALFLPAMGLGLLGGEWLHRRVDGALFRRGVAVLLAVSGASLLYRSLPS